MADVFLSRQRTRIGGTFQVTNRPCGRPPFGEDGGRAAVLRGKKIKGRKRHLAVDAEGIQIETAIQTASTQDRNSAGEGAVFREALGGWRLSKAEAGFRTEEARTRLRPRYQQETQRCRKIRRSAPSLGRGTDLRLDVALPTSGGELRAKLGKFVGVAAAGRMAFQGAPSLQDCNILKI